MRQQHRTSVRVAHGSGLQLPGCSPRQRHSDPIFMIGTRVSYQQEDAEHQAASALHTLPLLQMQAVCCPHYIRDQSQSEEVVVAGGDQGEVPVGQVMRMSPQHACRIDSRDPPYDRVIARVNPAAALPARSNRGVTAALRLRFAPQPAPPHYALGRAPDVPSPRRACAGNAIFAPTARCVTLRQ